MLNRCTVATVTRKQTTPTETRSYDRSIEGHSKHRKRGYVPITWVLLPTPSGLLPESGSDNVNSDNVNNDNVNNDNNNNNNNSNDISVQVLRFNPSRR